MSVFEAVMEQNEQSPWAQPEPDWSSASDREGVALTHADERYLEVRSYDYDAPDSRRWTVTMTDLQTGESVTLAGELQHETTAAALQQIGALGI